MKTYIIFDLEWNQSPGGKEDSIERMPFEIIELGAVKLDQNLRPISEFHRLITPQVYTRLHYKISEVTHMDIQELKTEAGRRDIPLTTDARKSLIRQKELYLLLGKGQRQQETAGVSDYVFTNTQGKPYATNAINSMLKSIMGAYNKLETERAEKEFRIPVLLPHISAHILRHTACTRLAESGLEPKVLQYIMGHANISATMDIYTHLDFSQIQKKMEEVQGNVKIG